MMFLYNIIIALPIPHLEYLNILSKYVAIQIKEGRIRCVKIWNLQPYVTSVDLQVLSF